MLEPTVIAPAVNPRIIREAHTWLLAQATRGRELKLSDQAAHWLEERGLLDWVLYESGGIMAEITERGRGGDYTIGKFLYAKPYPKASQLNPLKLSAEKR